MIYGSGEFVNTLMQHNLIGCYRIMHRSHWGKHVALSADHLRGQYPRWDAFRRMRAALDPFDVLANDFSRRYGL